MGRHVPTEADPEPQVYRMKLWSLDDTRAKSKFWCVAITFPGAIRARSNRSSGARRLGAASPASAPAPLRGAFFPVSSVFLGPSLR